ncbi:MAG: type II toxin-antitoxin system mRNA interferase toxin, RelE/StbE family [Bacteroidota bacterium]|nr:type II toxin-antitoxin system mRNA interferase toxin, RelE/StbE family [Bacteroidota bacterium]
MKVSFDPAFKRAFRKRIAASEKLKQHFFELLNIFMIDPFDAKLRTHKLSGKLDGLYSFRVDYDVRVVFYFADKDKIVFLDIGTHDEVY